MREFNHFVSLQKGKGQIHKFQDAHFVFNDLKKSVKAIYYKPD